jgi:hypothetical protein
LYDDVDQLMLSGAKGRNVYQGSSLAVQQALAINPGDVGEPSGEAQVGDTDATTMMSRNLPDDDEDIYGPSTPPPPTPSPSKRRFSALESAESSSQSAIPGSSSAPSGITATSRSGNSTLSAKRGRMTGAIAISSLGHELSDIKDILRKDLELTKTSTEAREERKRQEIQEKEQLEQKRLEREHQERERPMEQDPMLRAIILMQDVDSDLSPEDQVTLAELFSKELDSAKTYLALRSDPVRKAWIKRKLAQAETV